MENVVIRSHAGLLTTEGRTISGIAVPYNSDSHDIGFIERFSVGSLTDTIKDNHIELWLHHDRTRVLGSQASNLKLEDRADGLHYSALLPENNTDADNLISLVKAKVIGGTSFGFFPPTPNDQTWKREGIQTIREIHKAQLEHISPVVSPAYPATSAMVRSLGMTTNEIEEEYGIDLNKLSGIFVAIKRHLKISEDDAYIIKEAFEILGSIQKPKLKNALKNASKILI